MGGISFAPVPGTDGKYAADSEGTIYGPSGVIKQSPRSSLEGRKQPGNGHLRVGLYYPGGRRHEFAHRVIYAAFHGSIPPGLVVRHMDDDETNNRLSNLALGTHADNVADAVRAGTHRSLHQSGELGGGAKLTSRQVSEIRERYSRGGVSTKALGEEYGVAAASVCRIMKRVTWKESV